MSFHHRKAIQNYLKKSKESHFPAIRFSSEVAVLEEMIFKALKEKFSDPLESEDKRLKSLDVIR